MTTKVKAHVSDEKKRVVKQFTDLINKYEVVAVVDVENLPAKQLNNMRASLRDKATLLMTKRRLLKLALVNSASKKPGIDNLKNHLKGMPALLFSNENPFKLFKILKKNKSKAPIKGGQVTPQDIIVPAGGTNFAPGPVIGELGGFGIKSGVENGKIAIKQDKLVAKEGEVVKQALASLLTRLQIYPMQIGLNLVAAYQDGGILTKKDLDIDEDVFATDLKTAVSDALSLSMSLSLPLKENIKMLIQKAHREAFSLADSQDIVTSDNVEKVLAKAEAQATALKIKVPDAGIQR